MNSAELKKLLKSLGAEFDASRGKGGHVTVRLNGRSTIVPMQGSRKELGKGLVAKIMKDLGVK